MTQALSPIKPLAVSAMTATTALGAGCQPLLAALRAGRSGLKPCDFETARLPTWIGEAPGIEYIFRCIKDGLVTPMTLRYLLKFVFFCLLILS